MSTRGVWALALAWTVAVGAGGCDAELPPPICGGGPCHSERVVSQVFQEGRPRVIDLLVVVDDTPAIADAAVAEELSNLGQVLEFLPDGIPDTHFAFIPATVPEAGCTPPGSRAATCGVAGQSPFLITGPCGLTPNYSGTLHDAVACLGDFGVEGCGSVQPLEAVRRALEGGGNSGPLAGNPGFLRPEAYLMILIISGRDDASPRPVAEYVDLLKSLKADPYQIMMSVVGPSATDCSEPISLAPRLQEAAQGFGPNGLVARLCDHRLGQALSPITLGWWDAGPWCLPDLRDTDLEQADVQPECSVEDQVIGPDGTRTTTVLPSCAQGAPPCWVARRAGSFNCPRGASTVSVQRPANWCYQLSTRTSISCVACLDPADPGCS